MKINLQIFFVLLTISFIISAYPVAIFHGLGDICSINHGMADFFSNKLGGVYSKCLETGGGPLDFLTSFKAQAEKACNQIKNDVNFQKDFSVVGISQGALLARYVIESCDMEGTVKRFVSIGGPQMGVANVPHCLDGEFCKIVNKIVDSAVYFGLAQNYIGPAGYFKDMQNYKTYLNYSIFLPDLNNEKEVKNDSYKKRFLKLEKVVLIKFSEDTMIIPKETAWFQFYDENNVLQSLKDSKFYLEDYIGLRQLNEEKKVQFVELNGNHLHFNYDDIEEYMIPALK